MASGPGFKDHFSAQSAGYARHRPHYPPELFTFLAGLGGRQLAWDCATGNGQAAIALAGHFDRVIATDASSAQIEAAIAHPGVSYRVATAEQSGLEAEIRMGPGLDEIYDELIRRATWDASAVL